MSKFDKALRFVIVIIGIGLIVLMGDMRITLDEVKENQAESEQRGYMTRASTCRIVLALQQPVKEGEPCADPNVTVITEGFDVVPIGRGSDHADTQTLLCQVPVVYTESPDFCDEVLARG